MQLVVASNLARYGDDSDDEHTEDSRSEMHALEAQERPTQIQITAEAIAMQNKTDPKLGSVVLNVKPSAVRGQNVADMQKLRSIVKSRAKNKKPVAKTSKRHVGPKDIGSNKVAPEQSQTPARPTERHLSLRNRGENGEDLTEHDLSPEMLAKAEANRKRANLQKCWKKMRHAGFVPIISVISWITVGTCIYHFGTGFYWSQAFFYAVDTGFSVGFGAFVEGTWNDSIIHIPSDKCGLQACDNASDYHGSLRSACVMMSYEPDLASMFYTVLHILFGASMVATALTLLLIYALERNDFSPEELRRKEIDLEKQRKAQQNMEHNTEEGNCLQKCTTDFVEYWQQAVKTTLFKSLIFLICWMAAAISYGMAHEGWSFVEGLYFAVSAVSTAGLQSPTHHYHGNENNCTNAPNGECSTFPMLFTGIYCFVGVPLFAMVLGGIAGFQVDRMIEQKTKAKLNKNIQMSEFEYANKLNGDDSTDSTIDFCEYLQLALLRSGSVDQDFLNDIREQFSALDINGDGGVTRTEVAAMSLFSRFDVDGSGTIDWLEYLLCVDALNEFFPELDNTYSRSQLQDAFIKVSLIDIDDNGNISLPKNLQLQLKSYKPKDLSTRRITRVQFMIWCRDNVSAMAKKLNIDTAVADEDGDGIDDEQLFDTKSMDLERVDSKQGIVNDVASDAISKNMQANEKLEVPGAEQKTKSSSKNTEEIKNQVAPRSKASGKKERKKEAV